MVAMDVWQNSHVFKKTANLSFLNFPQGQIMKQAPTGHVSNSSSKGMPSKCLLSLVLS